MLFFLLACSSEKQTALEPTVLEWGSWELATKFVSETETCAEMGASGASMTTLYGEMDVFGAHDIELRLGTLILTGFRDAGGFFASSFQEIPITGDDSNHPYGITAELDGESKDPKSFYGNLNYILDFPNGYCSIGLEVDAFWLYYEPPPDCGS